MLRQPVREASWQISAISIEFTLNCIQAYGHSCSIIGNVPRDSIDVAPLDRFRRAATLVGRQARILRRRGVVGAGGGVCPQCCPDGTLRPNAPNHNHQQQGNSAAAATGGLRRLPSWYARMARPDCSGTRPGNSNFHRLKGRRSMRVIVSSVLPAIVYTMRA